MSGYYDRRDERSRVSEGLNHLYEWFCVNSEEELGRLIYHFPNYRFSSQEMSFIIDEYRKQRSSAFKAFLEFIRYRDERDIDYVTNETLVRFTKEEVFPRMIRMFQDATRPRRDEPYLRGNYGRSPDPYPRTSFSTNQFDVSESTRGMDAFFRNNRPSSNIRDNVYEVFCNTEQQRTTTTSAATSGTTNTTTSSATYGTV